MKYPTEPHRSVRCSLNTLPNTPVRFGTNAIPVPRVPVYPLPQSWRYGYLFGTNSAPVSATSVSSVLFDTGTRHFGKFGIVSVPVPDTSASFRKNSIMVPDTWYVRYGLNTGTRHFGKVGTPTQIYPRYRYTQTAIPREQVFVGYDTGDIGYFVRQYRHVMTSAYAAFWRDTIQQYQVCWSVW